MTTGQRIGARIAAFAAGGVVVVLIILFALRIPIADALAEAYLASEGAPSEVRIDGWDRDRLTARVKIGTESDFTADRVTLFLDPQHWLPHVESVSIASTRAHV